MNSHGISPFWAAFNLFLLGTFLGVGLVIFALGGVQFGVLWALGALMMLCASFCFDRALLIQYLDHRDAWIADGRPCGFLWWAPECNFFNSANMGKYSFFAWLFTTPEWIKDSPTALTWVRRFRSATLVAAAAYVPFIAALVIAAQASRQH